MPRIYVGTPENDRIYEAGQHQTIAEVLEANDVRVNGLVQHNGNTIPASKMNKTTSELGIVENDTIYVVQKHDSAE